MATIEGAREKTATQVPGPVESPATPSRRERLLAMRVSRIIEAHDDALDALIKGGFAPLANPVMRLAMAHTVTLGQAFRIRGQGEAEREELIACLLELEVDGRERLPCP